MIRKQKLMMKMTYIKNIEIIIMNWKKNIEFNIFYAPKVTLMIMKLKI